MPFAQTASHLPQPLFTPIEKELFYVEFTYPIWAAPPVRIGGAIGFSASFGVSIGGRACIADRRFEVVLTPEASLAVRALRDPSDVFCRLKPMVRRTGDSKCLLGHSSSPRRHRDGHPAGEDRHSAHGRHLDQRRCVNCCVTGHAHEQTSICPHSSHRFQGRHRGLRHSRGPKILHQRLCRPSWVEDVRGRFHIRSVRL